MENPLQLVPFKDRRYEDIPVDKVKVINSRNRESEQFDMNIESIKQVGLLKPIRVNDRFLERTGFYELICGEGRLLAHKRMNAETVRAEVITCSRKEAYLQSLIENIARTKPGSMDFARELKRLHDEGWSFERIARVACKNESYIRHYIKLVEQGEERLIHGVEQGIFPIKFATQVASSDDSRLQHILMDAFDEGRVTTNNFSQARRLVAQRARGTRSKKVPKQYTVVQLRKDIADVTRSKKSYVREVKTKENRFMTLLSGINELWQDAELVEILHNENLSARPELVGNFHYEN
jgi:ParB family chromosome partitioning protein